MAHALHINFLKLPFGIRHSHPVQVANALPHDNVLSPDPGDPGQSPPHITAQRALENQLRQKQKMEAVGQLAGGIAHDFNNLLTVILSHAQFLLDEPVAAEGANEDATAIRDAALRAAALTRQLLAFSRRQVLLPAAIHLHDVVARLEPMLHRHIGEHIRFTTVSHGARDLVLADRGQLEQVITNLVLNARDAMPRGGALTVEVGDGALDDEVTMHVPRRGVPPKMLVSAR